MGVIKRGILGGFSGKVANVVGSSWKGIATLKSLPLSVANPNTAGQIAQRTKMANAVFFAQAILTSIIKPLCDRFASGQSGFNLFIQRNIALFALDTPSVPANLILSNGNIEGATDASSDATNGSPNASFFWNDVAGPSGLDSDELYAVAQNRTTKEIVASTPTLRTDGSLGFVFIFSANLVTGQHVDMWASFRRADGTQVSDTTYEDCLVHA
jgi:hypothetical protein